MNGQRNTTRRGKARRTTRRWTRSLVALSAAVVTLAGIGCTQRAGLEIPREAYVVGGGRVITYEAQADGILFLVDQRNLLASHTIRKGEVFEVDGNIEAADGQVIDVIESRLYFLPHRTDVFGRPLSGYRPGDITELTPEGAPVEAPAETERGGSSAKAGGWEPVAAEAPESVSDRQKSDLEALLDAASTPAASVDTSPQK